ncbi:MAG: ribonuclease R, partial [Bacteroidales bacterium]|nr:ribonuclease R [Bacteroidales bacterium]
MSKKSTRKPKKRTLKNSFAQQILSVFAKNPHSLYNYKQIGRMLGIGDKAGRRLIDEMLVQMVKDGIIDSNQKGKYKLKEEYVTNYTQTKMVEGTVDMKKTGKAYIICKELDEDVFVGSNNTNHAFHGDRVSVSLFPKRGGRKVEGQVIEILERKKTQFVGVIEISNKYAFVIPDKENMPFDFFVPLDKLNKAKNGDKVLVNFVDWPTRSRNPFGEIAKVLGKPGNNNVEM